MASEMGCLHALASREVVEDVPYVDLWMDTHTSRPSWVVIEEENSNLLVKDWLVKHIEVLEKNMLEGWGELPFLFKIDSLYSYSSFLENDIFQATCNPLVEWRTFVAFISNCIYPIRNWSVLSVIKALSIQVHLDNKIAQVLHETQP